MGSFDAVAHLFSNLDLSDGEKEAMHGDITNCHTFMSFISSVEDYDSVMLAESDVVEYDAAYYPSFRRGWGDYF